MTTGDEGVVGLEVSESPSIVWFKGFLEGEPPDLRSLLVAVQEPSFFKGFLDGVECELGERVNR